MIILRNLTKKYKNKTILDNINYKFEDKGMYIIQGNNGAGKTTLLNLLALLDNDYFGEIIIDDINTKNKKQATKDNYRFENINYIRPKNNIPFFIKMKDLYQLLDKENIPIDISPFENKKLSDLSGGEEILFTYLLIHNNKKKILLLDEITSQLDNKNTNIILKSLIKESKNKLVIFATHDKRITSLHFKKITIKGGKLYD